MNLRKADCQKDGLRKPKRLLLYAMAESIVKLYAKPGNRSYYQ